MKTIIHYLCILLIAFSFSSCEDFLTEIPQDTYSVDGKYKNQVDFDQAIAGIYTRNRVLYSSTGMYDSWYRYTNVRADDNRPTIGYVYGFDLFTENSLQPEFLLTGWKTFYQIISFSNLILDKIDDGEFTDPNMKEYIRGEAYFFRAYAYWSLCWQFGGVPLYDREVSVDEIRTIPRSTQAETFDFAIDSYKNAFDRLPEEWTGSNIGRITKYAAAGMLARLYLFRGNFAEAKPYLASIINSGKYRKEPEYIDVFSDRYNNGPERVWAIQFAGGNQGHGTSYPSSAFPEQLAIDNPWTPFNVSHAVHSVSESLVEAYEPGDLRFDHNLATNAVIAGRVDDRYWNTKFIHWVTYRPVSASDWAINFAILRYTDVEMMYAEVLNEEGYSPSGDAFRIINEVRARAGLAPLDPAVVDNQAKFRDAIKQERRIEFCWEGLRWLDLIRWGDAVQVMNEFFNRPENPRQGNGQPYEMKPHQVVFQIPFDQLTRYNDENILWQNPGY